MLDKNNGYPYEKLKILGATGGGKRVPVTEPGAPLAHHDESSSGTAVLLGPGNQQPVHQTATFQLSGQPRPGQRDAFCRGQLSGQGFPQPTVASRPWEVGWGGDSL